MFWLRSSSFQVLPASSDRNSALRADSMNAYTTDGFEGATETAMRPHGLVGSPLADLPSSSCQVAPPSVLVNNPLPLGASGPAPPERNVHPCRRTSHNPANSVPGVSGFIAIMPQPVEAFAPFRICVHVVPPSVVL